MKWHRLASFKGSTKKHVQFSTEHNFKILSEWAFLILWTYFLLHCAKKGVLDKSFSQYKHLQISWSHIFLLSLCLYGQNFSWTARQLFFTLLNLYQRTFKQNWIIKEFWFSWRFAHVSTKCKKRIILKIKANRCVYVLKPSWNKKDTLLFYQIEP